MGFDNECILNMQSLPGEYFCPVCRLLVYPNEALQTLCTHLYCKPCLTYVVGSTRACPYDGYLVTETDAKPLVEVNKPVAEAIGQIPVHCLYYRSGCTWQGSMTECITHCSGCAFGNSPVVCNRCSTQIVHRQVQEHALNCPGVPPQAQQPDSTLAPVVEQTQATGQESASQAVTVPNAVQSQNQGNITQSEAAAQTSQMVSQVSAHEQWYQQYYQQYPGYDPHQQHYPQYDPYQQQQYPQQQSQPQSQYMIAGQPQPQAYTQPQQQLQALVPSHSQTVAHVQSQPQTQQQSLSQPQLTHPQPPLAVRPQMQAQVNSQQQQPLPSTQVHSQIHSQVHLPTQAPVGIPHAPVHLQTRPQHLQPQSQPYFQPQLRPHVHPQPSLQHPVQQARPQQPYQPQSLSGPAVTGHQSYPQSQPNQQVSLAVPQQHAQQQSVPQPLSNQMPAQFPSHQPPARPFNPPPQSHMPMPHLQQAALPSHGQPLKTPHQSLPNQQASNHIPPQHLPQHQTQFHQQQGSLGHFPGQQVPPFIPHQPVLPHQSVRLRGPQYPHAQPQLQQNFPGSQGFLLHHSARPVPLNQGLTQQYTPESMGGPAKFSQAQVKSGQTLSQTSMPQTNSQQNLVIEQSSVVQSTSQSDVRSPSQLAAADAPTKQGENEPDRNGRVSHLDATRSSRKADVSDVNQSNEINSSAQNNVSNSKFVDGEGKQIGETADSHLSNSVNHASSDSVHKLETGALTGVYDKTLDAQVSKPLVKEEMKSIVTDKEDDIALAKKTDQESVGRAKELDSSSSKDVKRPLSATGTSQLSSQTDMILQRQALATVSETSQHDKSLMQFSRQGLSGYGTVEYHGMPPSSQFHGKGFIQSGYSITEQNMASGPPPPLHDWTLQGSSVLPGSNQGRWPREEHLRPQGLGAEQFPYHREKQPHGPFSLEIPPGVLPGHGASTTFGRGVPHVAHPQGPSQGHMPPHINRPMISQGEPLPGPALGGSVSGMFEPGSVKGRGPLLLGGGSQIGLPSDDGKERIVGAQDLLNPHILAEKRYKLQKEDRLMAIADEGFRTRPEDQFRPSSLVDKREFQEDLKQFPPAVHLGSENYFSPSRSFNRSYSSYSGSGPYLHPTDIEERSRFHDGMGRRADIPDFLGHVSDFGQHRLEGLGPMRSPGREYPHLAGRFGGSYLHGLSGQIRSEEGDDRDFYGFSNRSKPFDDPHDVVGGSSFIRSRFPLSSHTRRGEIEGHGNVPLNLRSGDMAGSDLPGQLRPGEPFSHFRGGERLNSQHFGSHFRIRESLGPSPTRIGGPTDVGGFPRHFSSHPRDSIGDHIRLNDIGFRSFSSQGFPNDGGYYNQDDIEPFNHSRKRRSGNMGWCRICKVDCGTVDGLELHSQTKEHQKVAMDLVLSIKQENAKKQKISSEEHVAQDDSNQSRNASNESRGQGKDHN